VPKSEGRIRLPLVGYLDGSIQEEIYFLFREVLVCVCVCVCVCV
jgi:hypothetical protein